MEAAKKMKFTIEDIYDLPDGQRAELIDGNLYMMAPPSAKHQEIVGELHRVVSNYLHSKGGKCKPYLAPFGVFLDENDNYVEPDISVICDKNKVSDRGCEGAPDWIIEVVSPGSHRNDYMIKLFKYRTAGVREYWIVDPRDCSITVYNFAGNDMEKKKFSDTVRVNIYEDLYIDFSQLDI